jgi:hypothetical protein
MNKCYWANCPNDAKALVYRHATEDERDWTHHESYSTFVTLKQQWVCNEHLEAARKEYPHIANTMLMR